MSEQLAYDPSAASKLLSERTLSDIAGNLEAARKETLQDVSLLGSSSIPEDKVPLDSGFIEWPALRLSEFRSDPAQSLVGRITHTADMLRSEVDSVVTLGIGGSYMGARALFEALCHPYHNELHPQQRRGVPRMYFEGNNVDNDAMNGLIDLLSARTGRPGSPAKKWAIVVISKSGGTMETAVAFRVFREQLDRLYGADSDEAKRYVVPVTGESGSKLRALATERGYENVFPVPDGIGGRFSILTAVGLLPAAVLGLDIEQLLAGAADMTERFRTAPVGDNPVLDYVGIGHLFETDANASVRILSTWGSRLEAVGFWYDQLLSESLGKVPNSEGIQCRATPITCVNTRDLHSRGQQHQEGFADKLITNLHVQTTSTSAIRVRTSTENQDGLNTYAGKSASQILQAAFDGTNQAYADANRPTADILLPTLNEYSLGQLFQMLMLATAVEGRMLNINPYGQPGVEAYKTNMKANLA